MSLRPALRAAMLLGMAIISIEASSLAAGTDSTARKKPVDSSAPALSPIAPSPTPTPTPPPTPPPATSPSSLTSTSKKAAQPSSDLKQLAPSVETGMPRGPFDQPKPFSGIHGRHWGATLSAQVPHPIWIDADYLFSTSLTSAIGAGGLKIPLKAKSGATIDLGISGADARFRWHPMNGSFFLGLALGYQAIQGSATDNFTFTVPAGLPISGPYTIKATVQASISSPYLTPQFGWFWVFETGFCIGFDFGLQIPFAPKTTFSLATDNQYVNDVLSYLEKTQQYQDLQNQVQDAGNKVGKFPLPYTTVLRLGWMFR